jgi:hypothetical protein
MPFSGAHVCRRCVRAHRMRRVTALENMHSNKKRKGDAEAGTPQATAAPSKAARLNGIACLRTHAQTHADQRARAHTPHAHHIRAPA